MPLDEIIYTRRITEEELKRELNKVLNQLLRELSDNGKKGVTESK